MKEVKENTPSKEPLRINAALAKFVDSGPLKNWDMIRANIYLDNVKTGKLAMPHKRCHAASCIIEKEYTISLVSTSMVA